MGRIALVAVDLDGTLLTSQRSLAPRGAHLLREAAHRGVHIILATTRNPDTVGSYCRELQLNQPMICTNGAQVWGSPSGPAWAHHALARELALSIAKLADARAWELSITIASMTYWKQRPGQKLGRIGPGRTIVAANADAVTGDVVRILVHEPEAIQGLQTLCQSQYVGQCRAELYRRPDGFVRSLGIFAPKANKGTALSLVCERLHIAPQHVLAIGDNPNDLEMRACAEIFVAVANAPDLVKQRATAIAPSNDNEGVAWALQTFVLGV